MEHADQRECNPAGKLLSAEHVQGSHIKDGSSQWSRWSPPTSSAVLSWDEYSYASGQHAPNQNRGGLGLWQRRKVLAYIAVADRTQIAAQRDQLTTQRDQLKTNLDKWTAAVSERDQALKQAGQQIQQLSTERNEAVSKYNDLAGKYNQAVKDLNSAKSKP